MVFVFGIDIPLVELIFVLTLILVLLFALLIYIMVKQNQLNNRLAVILDKENIELDNLKEITKEEKTEAKLLGAIRTELDKLVYGQKVATKKVDKAIKKVGKTPKKAKQSVPVEKPEEAKK